MHYAVQAHHLHVRGRDYVYGDTIEGLDASDLAALGRAIKIVWDPAECAPVVAPTATLAPTAVGAGLDLGLVKDATGLVIVARSDERYSIKEAVGFKRKPKAPVLSLDILCPRIAKICKRHGVTDLWGDGHEFHEARGKLEKLGVNLVLFPSPAKATSWAFARSLLTDGRLALPRLAIQLRRELKSVSHKLTPGGKTEIIPPRRGGTHCDISAALVLALYGAQRAEADTGPRAINASNCVQSYKSGADYA